MVQWSFPPDFVFLPSQLKRETIVGITGVGQQIVLPTATTISGVALFTEPDGGQFNNSESYIEIRKDNSGSMDGQVIATSEEKTLDQHDAPGERRYSFDAPVALEANTFYWLVPLQGPSERTNGTRIYGSLSDSYPDGFWASKLDADAYFRLVR
jgi:hypothetical protein